MKHKVNGMGRKTGTKSVIFIWNPPGSAIRWYSTTYSTEIDRSLIEVVPYIDGCQIFFSHLFLASWGQMDSEMDNMWWDVTVTVVDKIYIFVVKMLRYDLGLRYRDRNRDKTIEDPPIFRIWQDTRNLG